MAGQNQRSVTRDMPKLTLRASFDLSTVNVEARTVDLTWTTGARVLRGGLFTEPYLEELSLDPKNVRMARMQSGAAPVLNSHRSDDIADILGVVENATLSKGEGRATVRFDSGPEGSDAFRRVQEKTLRNVSVGYLTYQMQQVKDDSTKTPVFRATDWEPFEISLLPIGADAGAVTRSAGGTTACEFIQERAMPDETTTPTTAPAVAPTTLAPATASLEQTRAAATAERARVLGIQRAGVALKRPEAEVAAAITNGTELDAYREAAIEATAVAPAAAGGPIPIARGQAGAIATIGAGEDQRDKQVRGMSAWLISRSGIAHIHKQAAEKNGEKIDLDAGEFRGMTLLDVARRCLEDAGVRTAGMTGMELAGRALTMRSGPTGGLSATADFPMILENVLYKTLVGQYNITPDTWSRFCMTGSVQDFRPNKRYRLGSFGALSSKNEAGEYVSKSIPDAERQAITAATKGNIIGITREAIINDDMGAFSSLATMLGRAAKLTVELDVYALLAQNAGLGPTMNDGLTLFHATHANLTTGAALGSNAIDLDRVAMASQKDPSGNEVLQLTPAILVLPISLGGQARQINTSQYDFDAVSTKNPWVPNKVGNLFRDIVDTARITGTRRYLFADPGVAPTIEVAFLDGQQQPFMDVQQGWRVDGVEWKVRLDYAVGAIDFRGAITNAGV